MATWKAFLVDPTHKDHDAATLVALIQYYDADDPANAGVGPGPPLVIPVVVLHARMFVFPSGTTRQQIQAAIVLEGQMARDTTNQAAAINAQFPAGSTLAIP